MVAVKRNGGGDYDGLPYAHGPELGRKCASFSFGLPGRGWDKPGLNMFSSQVPPMSFYPSSSLSKRFESNVWIVRIVYVTAALSWIATSRFSISYQIAMERLSMDSVLLRNQMAHVSEEASTIEKLVIDERRVLSQLKKTSGALQHELRLVKAVETTTGGPIKPAPRSSNEKLIKGWLSSRKDSLVTKIYQLQRYLQADSRTSVVETYGIGPHRVKFTIDVLKEGGKRSLQSFIVETAPVELMPASIHMFLDMISAGIWDNTVFLHHEEVEHVVAAAHVDANTQQVRLNEISKIGWIGLGYPEYSDSFKHKQYTLGFAGVGPNFYINTLDNSIDHGPGGQLHHTLPSDADPCFAKVVEGFNVVDDLIRLGSLKNNTKGQGKHPWIDASHSSTRIVSAMMLDS